MFRRSVILSVAGAFAGSLGARRSPAQATPADALDWLHVVVQGPYNVRSAGGRKRQADFRLSITCNRCRSLPPATTTVDVTWEYDPMADYPVAPRTILAVVNSLSGLAYLFADEAVNATITYIQPNGKLIRAWSGKTR